MNAKSKKMQHAAEDAADWESGKLGLSEEHAKKGQGISEQELEEALALKAISIRLEEDLLADLKAIAHIHGMKYQPLVRQVLQRWTAGEKKKIAIEMRKRMAEMSDNEDCGDDLLDNDSAQSAA